MARLFPKIEPDEIGNPGERTVARALLEQLPRRVEVFHGFNWLARGSHGTLLEGECDFILLEPEKGLLFVEVKGGSLVFDGEKWIREVGAERRELNKDPFAQAQQGMYDIIDIVRSRYGVTANGLPFTYGFAVAFPDCRVSGWLPPSIQRELILDAVKLRTVPDSLRRIFASFARRDHRSLRSDEVASVREALYPKYQLVPVLWRKIEDQEERLRRTGCRAAIRGPCPAMPPSRASLPGTPTGCRHPLPSGCGVSLSAGASNAPSAASCSVTAHPGSGTSPTSICPTRSRSSTSFTPSSTSSMSPRPSTAMTPISPHSGASYAATNSTAAAPVPSSPALRQQASACDEARKNLDYFTTDRARMAYPAFRAGGLCVSTGVVEGTCKSVIGNRLKRGGMHWTVDGANAIIALRCALHSNRFDDYWERQASRS